MQDPANSSPVAQNALDAEARNSMLGQLIDTLNDYAVIFLDTAGHVTSWNRAAQRIKGWTAEEITGQHFSRFYTPEDNAKNKTATELEAAAGDGRYEDEGWRVRKDGKRLLGDVIITALRDKEGNLKGFGKVTRDLSERRLAEEQIKRQAQEIFEMAVVPVVQVREGIVLVPLIGTLDSQRTQQLMEHLLQRVTETGSGVPLLDITGVPAIHRPDPGATRHRPLPRHHPRLSGRRTAPGAGHPQPERGARGNSRFGEGSMSVAISALQERVLESMERYSAAGLILDISAVETLDSFFARTVSEAARMVTLMGGRTIIVGMRPSVAMTATQMGLKLNHIETALNVDRALDPAMALARISGNRRR